MIRRKHKIESWLLPRISPRYRLEKGYMSAWPSKALRYFIAIAATAVAFTARFLLKSALGNVAPLLTFTLSVVVSAWYGGLGPGLLATALSLILGDYFFIAESVAERDRKSTRLNSSHLGISYAVFCLKKKKKTTLITSNI